MDKLQLKKELRKLGISVYGNRIKKKDVERIAMATTVKVGDIFRSREGSESKAYLVEVTKVVGFSISFVFVQTPQNYNNVKDSMFQTDQMNEFELNRLYKSETTETINEFSYKFKFVKHKILAASTPSTYTNFGYELDKEARGELKELFKHMKAASPRPFIIKKGSGWGWAAFVYLHNLSRSSWKTERRGDDSLVTTPQGGLLFRGLKEVTVKETAEELKRRTAGESAKAAVKWVHRWVNSDANMQQRPGSTLVENLQGYRTRAPVKVYRGVRFKSKRQARAFTDKYRKGASFTYATTQSASSWTTDVETAEKFARYAPSGSHGGAILMFFTRMGSQEQYDGEGGYVISTTLDPDQQLCDVSAVPSVGHPTHGNEREIIALPGKFSVKLELVLSQK